ncbi:g-type lectin s-receptor-like serine/threonine-protein kinase rlk1 [Phtheirospermum japonicum]|uniref:G-type lectin s-receptor-like serine/threonine-protein kinase rlk1 n=1 Tax=Phtheirospermum japonicum TaxID=374723 RepID=A0A830C5M6_9LAMI|nr:g-type lectin s-receptor-like serine/threonine-protein kinase rlk1 [Phtheirospermum japonicum]
MNDTGNFVLSGRDSTLLWQSFQNPSDTILPTQTIGQQLISKNRESDFSLGRFYAGMSTDGSFVLNTKSVYSNLDFDDEYYNSGSPNICMSIDGQKGSGACGFNNVCSLEDSNSRPICTCPEGFLLVDPSNRYGDCKSNFTENCVDQGEYDLVVVHDVDWPFNDYEQMNKSNLDECKSACYNDYFCGAAIFRSESCWKKRLPLSNGRVDKSLGATAFLKVRKN